MITPNMSAVTMLVMYLEFFSVIVMARANACYIAFLFIFCLFCFAHYKNKSFHTAAYCCCFVTPNGPFQIPSEMRRDWSEMKKSLRSVDSNADPTSDRLIQR